MPKIIDPTEIASMTDEEVAATNRKLVLKLVATRIVLPLATVLVVHVATSLITKKLASKNEIEA